MEIKKHDNGKKGAFYIEEGEERLAEMTYVWSGDKIIIDHTEVSPKLEGKGIGKQLVTKAVEMAREQNIKIMPLCPHAKRVLEKDDSYKDIIF